MIPSTNELCSIVFKQLANYGFDIDIEALKKHVPSAILRTVESISKRAYSPSLNTPEGVNFPRSNTEAWAIFLFCLSNECYKNGDVVEAGYIYSLNKAISSVDWLYSLEIPPHFWATHFLGSVLTVNAVYNDFLWIYQDAMVLSNPKKRNFISPILGHHNLLYAGAKLVGATTTGNYVIFSTDTLVVNEKIPDDCLVFGRSPNLVIKKRSHEEMLERFADFWLE